MEKINKAGDPADPKDAQIAALEAQVALLAQQVAALIARVDTPTMPRINRELQRVPSCVEGGTRHAVTRTKLRSKKLIRFCDDCGAESVVRDYTVEAVSP